MKKFLFGAGAVLEFVTGAALWAIVFILAVGALERNIMPSAMLSYAGSLIGYLMVAIVLLGCCLAIIDNGHVAIDILSRGLNGSAAAAADMLFKALSVIAGLLILAAGVALVQQSMRTGRMDYGLIAVPLWIPQLLIPVGGALMALLFAIVRRDPSQDETHIPD